MDRRIPGSTPLLSLIVPAFGVEDSIAETLRSILRASQRISLELIVIDDGSMDATLLQILEVLGQNQGSDLLVLSQENQGLSCVRNLGASLSRGVWVAFLDGDDWIRAEGFEAFVASAGDAEVDLILGGCEIFSEEYPHGKPFYHDATWRSLLEGASQKTTTLERSPELLALEPNVNYRWIRRAFYEKSQLQFPEGLFFEDIPVHFRMLAMARKIRLVSAPYYRYRVNRPGKITEEKGVRRFDALKTLLLALEELKLAGLGSRETSFALRSLDRLAWGCGTMTLPGQRWAYFKGLSRLYAGIPGEWREMSLRGILQHPKEAMLALLMTSRSIWILVGLTHLRDLLSILRRG